MKSIVIGKSILFASSVVKNIEPLSMQMRYTDCPLYFSVSALVTPQTGKVLKITFYGGKQNGFFKKI